MRAWILVASSLFMSGPVFGADGKTLFLEQKCNRCHAVEAEDIEATVRSERMRGPDLGEVGKERSAEWIVQFVKKEVEVDGKTHRSSYQGTGADLEAIATWLVGLAGK